MFWGHKTRLFLKLGDARLGPWARSLLLLPMVEIGVLPSSTKPVSPRSQPMASPEHIPTSAEQHTSDNMPQDADMGKSESLIKAFKLFTNFHDLCNEVLQMALSATKAATGSLMLLDKNGRHLAIAASQGINPVVAGQTRQRVGEGIAGRVVESGEPLLLVGRVGDDRFKGMGGRPGIVSSICVPVKSDGKTIGVINVNASEESPPYTEKDLATLTGLADQLGGTIGHSLQFQQIQQHTMELSIRAEIESVAASEESLPNKLAMVAERSTSILGVDAFMVYIVEDDKKDLRLLACDGLSMTYDANIRVPIGVGHVGAVAKAKRSITLRGFWDEEASEEFDQVMTFLVPIRHKGEILGVIVAEKTHTTPKDFGIHEILRSVASSIGFVISNTLSTDDSKRRLTALSALSELSVAMTQSEDRTTFAKLVAYSAAAVLEKDFALVRLIQGGNSGQGEMELVAVHGRSFPGEEDPILQLEARLIEKAMVVGEPCLDGDLPEDLIAPLMQEAQVGGVVCIPMLDANRVIGVVTLLTASGRDRLASSREYEIELATRLGDYATAAAMKFANASAHKPQDGERRMAS
jgi:GAF domain-containing protein